MANIETQPAVAGPLTSVVLRKIMKAQFFFIGKSNETKTILHAIRVRTNMMVLLVVKRQGLQRCVEFISTAHLLTNVAKMMSHMHMLVKLLFTEEMLLAKFAEVMCWQGQHAIMAIVTVSAVAVHVMATVGVLLTQESRTVQETRLAKLPPMHIPQVILKLLKF